MHAIECNELWIYYANSKGDFTSVSMQESTCFVVARIACSIEELEQARSTLSGIHVTAISSHISLNIPRMHSKNLDLGNVDR